MVTQVVLLLQNYFLLQTVTKPSILPIKTTNISAIKVTFIESDEVLWRAEIYQCVCKYTGDISWRVTINLSQNINH